jgi:hypothetical protein
MSGLEDDAGGYTNGQHLTQGKGKGEGSEGRGTTGSRNGNGKEGLPWSVDAVTNGPEGPDYFAEGSGSGSKKHLGGGLFGLASSSPSSPPEDGSSGGDGDMHDGVEGDPTARAGRDQESDSKARQAVCRTKSTRSVLGRGGGRVEPEEEGEAARLLRTIDFAARVGPPVGS